VIDELARLGVATTYEACGRRGLIDADLIPVLPGARIAGPARTVRCGQGDNRAVHAAMVELRAGDVLVLTMPEPAPVALIGDLLATQAQVHGAAGILVDAAIRDVDDLERLGLPIWTRWIRVRGATKDHPGELNVPVTVGGQIINPGDTVVLDPDGGCVVTDVAAAVEAGRAREENERIKRARLQAGALSYHLDGLGAA
jgi:4-hydroxy-4-methyl-2-oxoglutarate aldolase